MLFELGWFGRFLAERGPLLPEDEQLLFASWLFVPRTLFEVVESRPGDGVTLRDVRGGDIVEVSDPKLSRFAVSGQLLSGRAVSDGRDHLLIGSVFGVTSGDAAELMAILDDPDPTSVAIDLVAYRARMSGNS